jgi:hypothetical protein
MADADTIMAEERDRVAINKERIIFSSSRLTWCSAFWWKMDSEGNKRRGIVNLLTIVWMIRLRVVPVPTGLWCQLDARPLGA